MKLADELWLFRMYTQIFAKINFLLNEAVAAALSVTFAAAAAAYLFTFKISVQFSSTIWDKQIYGNKFLLKISVLFVITNERAEKNL